MLLLLTIAASAPAADRPGFDANQVTRETFSFSDFTEHMYRTGNDGSQESNNPVMRTMKETLLRLYPPGSDIQEFFTFLNLVVARELKNTRSIEDQSEFRRNGRKFGHAISPGGEFAVADYWFKLKFRVTLIDARAWLLPFVDQVYLMKIDIKDGKIVDLTITRS